MKKLIAFLLALIMVIGLAACAAGSTSEPESAPAPSPGSASAPASESMPEPESAQDSEESALIGISMPDKDIARWVRDGDCMKLNLEALGYRVDLQYAANDIENQNLQIKNMIDNGVEVLVICPISGIDLGTVLAQAKEAGVTVIAYDRMIVDMGAPSYYIAFDNWDVGIKQAQYIVDALDLSNAEEGTVYNIEFAIGAPEDSNNLFFYGSAMSVLQPYLDSGVLNCVSGQVDMIDVAITDWEAAKAQARFKNIIAANYADGTPLHAVLASHDSIAWGVQNALSTAYSNEAYPIITGQDCELPNVLAITNGRQAMSVFKDSLVMAAKAAEMVDAIVKGMEPPINDTKTYDNGTGIIPTFLCEPVVCTKDNYKEVLIVPGYYTEEELAG